MRLKTHNPSPIITKLTKIHHHPSIPSSCHHHHTATSTMMIAGGVSIRSLGFLLIFQWLCVFSQAFVIHHSSIYASSSRRLIVLPVSSTDDENHVPSSSSSALLQAIKTMPLLSDAGRAFHGRGGSFPDCEHLTLDWLGPVWLLTSFIELSDDELTEIGDALNVRWAELVAPSSSEQPLNWVYQCRADGAKTFTKLMAGEVPDPHLITENNLQYVVKVLHGKNHGIFLDMRHGRAWVQEHAKDQIILNLFAYTCAFSVAALQGGASEVINIDMAQGPLKIGQRNHQLNQFGDAGARFFAHDIFKTWGKIRKLGPYGIIVVDPPTFQKGSFVAKKDYIKILRRLPSFLEPDGLVLLCLNAPELDTEFLKGQVAEAAPELEFVERLENPSSFASKDPEKALKVLVYKMTAASA
jgi:23S rRNA (cytosine1962-C5)-methyltransferase